MKPQAVKFMIEAVDMDRAVSFYRDILGFEESIVSPYWSELTHGDAILGIHGGGEATPKVTGLSLQYADVDDAYRTALGGGATALSAPHQREGEPIILATIRDPEGNEIMLTQFSG